MTRRTWLLTIGVAIALAAGWVGAARLGPSPPRRSAHSEPASLVPRGPVVVTRSGKTFHRPGCRFIHGPAVEKSGGQAVASGYTPCVRCLPS